MKKLTALILAFIMVVSMAASLTGCAFIDSDRDEPKKHSHIFGADNEDDDDEDDDDGDDKFSGPASTTGDDEDGREEIVTRDDDDNYPYEEDETSGKDEVSRPRSVSLSEIEVIAERASLYERSVEDSYGKEYDGPYYDLCSYSNKYGDRDGKYLTQSFVDFNVDGEYGYLTGTYFTREDQEEDFDVELMIYADGELVYYSGPMCRRDRAVSFAVDIDYCYELRIISRSYDYTGMGTNPGIILTDAFVHEDYSGELTDGEYLNTDLISLGDVHLYSSNTTITAGAVKDAYGKVHKGFYLDLCSWASTTNPHFATAEYLLDGEYNYFSGTFFAREDQPEKYTINFKIYADEELIYESGYISRKTKAKDFCVDVSGCEFLRVETITSDYTSIGSNPGVILMNPVVSMERP